MSKERKVFAPQLEDLYELLLFSEDYDPFGDRLSNADLGLCPHGCRDDDGCDEPG